jgi:hypothetical protein
VLARIKDSLGLKRTPVIVSVDTGNAKFIIDVLLLKRVELRPIVSLETYLDSSQTCTAVEAVAKRGSEV